MSFPGNHRLTREFLVRNTRFKIGRFTYGFETLTLVDFDSVSSVSFGSFCSIASHSTIFVADHRATHRPTAISTYPFGELFQDDLGATPELPPEELNSTKDGTISVGNDVWLGRGITILPGIRIGDGAIVSANSHVTKNVEPYAVVGGNSAVHKRFRFDEDIRELLCELRWWELPLEAIRSIKIDLWRAPDAARLRDLIAQFKNAERYVG